MADTGAPPNPYSSMAAMPGPMPAPKKDANVEELMKGFHGIFKALTKMEAMEPGLSAKLAEAKKSMKDAVANVLKGDPSTLDDDKDAPPADSSAPPPPTPAAAPPGDAQSNTAAA
jgi:hypothetical protein